nr:NTP transferase domain-containing protein [Actinomyces sp. AC-20-1]
MDVVVLAGGTGARLGGVSKPDVVARGGRLIDHVLRGLDSLRGPLALGGVVVVAPEDVSLPDGVLRALEDPPLGGPVAGAGAGLLALRAEGRAPAPTTALLACDAPEAWRALPVLAARLAASPGADGAVSVDGAHRQYLVGVYRTGPLAAVVAPGGAPLRDVAVRRALGALVLLEADLGALRGVGRDLDTWEEVAAWERGG